MNVKDVAHAIVKGSDELFSNYELIYAGSFDPYANHHESIVRHLVALQQHLLDADAVDSCKVLLWPVGAYTGKEQITPPDARLTLLRRAVSALPVRIMENDLDPKLRILKNKSYTPTCVMETLFPLQNIWHVIGADNVEHIRSWESGEYIWEKAHWLVLSREGSELKELPPHSVIMDLALPGSCTDIRNAIATGAPWEHMVPRVVVDTIKELGLYGYKAAA